MFQKFSLKFSLRYVTIIIDTFVLIHFWSTRRWSFNCFFNNIFIIKQINYEFKKIIDLKYLWGMKITLGAISVAAGLANIILMILTSVSTCCPFCCSCCCSMIRESEQENRAIVWELELLPSVLVICDDDAEKLSNPSQRTKIICNNNRKQSPSLPPPYCSNKSKKKKLMQPQCYDSRIN